MPLGVSDDDGLEDGLEDGVRELVFHLPATGLSVAQISEADGNAVKLGGDDAKAVAATPFHAVLEIAAGYLLCIVGENPDGMENKHHRRHFNDDEREEEGEGEIDLACSSERTMSSGHEAYGESGNDYTAENQALG